jgi:hypothetical protein
MEPLGLLPSFLGARAYDEAGARLGHVADVLFDSRTQRPAWLLLVLLRAADRFVLAPAQGVRHHAGGLDLPIARALVRTAPLAAGPPNELGPEHARRLAVHYGVPVTTGPWAGLVEPSLGIVDDRVRMVG